MFTSVSFFFLLCPVPGYLLFYVNFRKASEVLPQKSYLGFMVNGTILSLQDRELTSS